MKFKKVEIQAFRAYDLAEDGTFDFTNGKETADFVSIYAPNGFGKTSFYDAVEWGVTHNIHRFLKRPKMNQQVAKTEKNMNAAEYTHILRNKFSDENLPAFVNLYTTTSNEPITKTLKKPRKGQPDYKFDEKETIRGYFQEVILSQEWIDSFLKEDDGAGRYKTFIKYFGDKELDQYYKCLVNLLKTNEDTIKDLKNQLKGFQMDLAFNGDQQVMDAINQTISKLEEKKQSLNHLDTTFDERESAVLSSIITSRVHELNQKIIQSQRLVELIEVVVSGSESIDPLEIYQHHQLEEVDVRQKIKDAETSLDDFAKLAKTENQLAALAKRKEDLRKSQTYHEELIAHFPRYTNIVSEVKGNSAKQNKKNAEIKDLNDKKANAINLLAKLNQEIERNLQDISVINSMIERVPLISEEINNGNLKLASLNASIAAGEKDLTTNLRALEDHRNILGSIDTVIEQIEQNLAPSVLVPTLVKFETDIRKLEEIRNRGLELRQSFQKRSAELEQQKSLQIDLAELLRKGLTLVTESKTSACPLCNQNYADYVELTNRISSNDSLDESLKTALSEQIKSEAEQSKNDVAEKALKEKLLVLLQNEKQSPLEKISFAIAGVNEIKRQLALDRADVNTLVTRINELNSQLSNLSVKDYSAVMETRLQNLQGLRETNLLDLSELQGDLDTMEMTIITANNDLKKLQDDRVVLIEDLSYTAILAYLNQRSDSVVNSITLSELHLLLNQLIDDLKECLEAEQQQRLIVDNLKNSTSSFNTEDLISNIAVNKERLSQLRQRISVYQEFVKNEFNFTVEGQTNESITEFVEGVREKQRKAINELQNVIGLFELLSKLKEEVIPFLRYQKAKNDEKAIKARIKFLNTTLKTTLETERNLVIAHIDEQINSFFFEDIINTLYRKIDPHPDYKEIKFKCDFTDNNPQLNVCVTDEKKVTLQIPNLYFSTAQLNILSLSIFLAKALHAKDANNNPLECIFIDDPIQAMDSINILSTIDLLRSITVNLGRQIILSTHDANFHNLLMKKIPDKLYNSKFMELETFGKVKQIEEIDVH
ncbi:AAA family ATPase [Sphingobacterium hungaricum]|uniref:RecF/RecN/SMC N-terminal domain-containing protein n=1 Tax=Sphingobacterium hungaricum TaxID=2082723 RepID=A0A928UX04_9SPHI|nr:hypothetical protein [Sphingobacterium hungaricum]MBE8714790.1 hypothetical protein [Sphingobacterium hungaricum]